VCHTCDNQACINPLHLFLGTQKDNVADMMMKKRDNRATGEKHWKAKLTPYQVQLIRRLRSEIGISQRVIADMFGIGATAVAKIEHRVNWPNV